MFEHILLETTGGSKWKKGVSIVVSTLTQCLLIAGMVVSPLLFTEAAPRVAKIASTWMPQPPEPLPGPQRPPAPSGSQRGGISLSRPESVGSQPDLTKITFGVPTENEPLATLDPLPSGIGRVPGGPSGVPGGIPGLGGGPVVTPPPPPPTVRHEPERPVSISTIDNARILYRPQPIYPQIARQTRTQGVVRLEAIISREGYIENLKVVSGHPLLVPAALDAVKQWRYQPTMLNGHAVEVITTIDVHFTLNQ
jgi:protein TonB